MDVDRHAAKQPDKSSSRSRTKTSSRGPHNSAGEAGRHRVDQLDSRDVDAAPAAKQSVGKALPATPCTPQECASMVNAVEEAIREAADITPDSGTATMKLSNLQSWLEGAGLRLPTPAAKDLQSLTAAAADSKRLKKQLEALREAELELAAREAEETAENFSVLEQENLSLAADNARLQQQIAELEALNKAATADAQQRAQHASSDEWVDGMEARATMALQRVEHHRRLSGVYEKKQIATLKQLDNAEEQLSAVKALTPTSRAQQKEMHRRMLQAEQDVQLAAAAAKEATEKLQRVLDEKEHVQAELQEIKKQLELQPLAQQHAELYRKLAEAHQTMLEEKQEHQKLTESLLEHAGRLSHKYHALSDDYGSLQRRYRHISSTNEQLAAQLKEAHEVLFELQATVQATPPAKRREQRHLLSRVTEAEQAVKSLEREKHQLHERLLQAQAFIVCLEQRGVGTSAPVQQQVVVPEGVSMETPVGKPVLAPTGAAATPVFRAPIAAAVTKPGITAAPAASTQKLGKENVEGPGAPGIGGAPVTAEADTFSGFLTPVKDRRNPLFDLPETPDSILKAESAPGALGGYAHLASFPVEPVSPILAAAAQAVSAAAGQQQKQQIQLSAATHELQTVQQEQLGLREEISKAKSALADIAGQLRASIGGSAVSARSSAAADSSSSSMNRSSTASTGLSKKPANSNLAAHSKPPSVASAGATATVVASRKPVVLSGGAQGSRTSSAKHTLNQTLHKQTGSLATSSRQAKQQRSQQPGAASVSAGEEFTFPKLSSSKAAAPVSSQKSGSSSNGSTGSSQGLKQQQQQKHWSNPLAQLQVQQHVAASSSKAMAPSGGTSATCSAATESAKGSLSLDDLIKDAESVSLEYGMSPNCAGNLDDTATTSGAAAAVTAATPAAAAHAQLIFGTSGVKTAHSAAVKVQPKTAAEAAARSVALALIQNQLTQESGCAAATSAAAKGAEQIDGPLPAFHVQQRKSHPQPPQSVAGSTRGPEEPVSMLDQQHEQQEQQLLMQQRLEQCLADTPGSACSSAAPPGRTAAAAAMQWLQQQVSPLPMAQLLETPPAVQPANSKAADMQSAVRTAAAGPAVASDAAPKAAEKYSPMSQAGTPLGMEGCASNFLGHQSPEVGSTKRTAISQQQRSLVTPSFATPTAVVHHRAALAGLFADDEAAADDATSGAHKEDGCNESAANVPLQWQQPADTPTAAAAAAEGDAEAVYLTPAAAGIPVHKGLAPARQQASAIATKPSDISQSPGDTAAAAAWSTPVGPAAKASETLQSAAAALLASISPAGTISPQDVVPDRILQQLTPEWLKELRQRCQQGTIQVQELRTQLGLATPQTAGHAPTVHVAAAMTPAVAEAADMAGNSDDEGQLQSKPTPPQCSDGQRSAAGVAAEAAGAAEFDPSPVSNQALASSLSQASSRSNIDKLRRQAMVQAAAAAAATPTADSGTRPGPSTYTVAAVIFSANSHEDLERSDSAGSLVQYMQQQQSEPPSHCRTGSLQQEEAGVSTMPYRPGCPTPGSAYSAAATPAAAGSPDIMLADLSNSRKLAKQLQEQLQRHLGNTASMPNIFSAPNVESDAARASDAAQLRHTASAYDAPLEPSGNDAISSQLPDAVGAADATPAQPPRTSSRLAGPAAADSNSPGSLLEAFPLTPGAALNANAESKMLSPSVQLDQLFEASVSQLQQPEQGRESGSKSISSYSMRRGLGAGAIEHVPASCPVTPRDSCNCNDSSAITLPADAAVGATQQPDNDAAVPAYRTPAHSSISTPETSARYSIRAHPLNSLAGGTQVTSGTHGMQAHTPCVSDAAHGHLAPLSAQPSPAIAPSIAEVTPSSMQQDTARSRPSIAAHQLSNVAEMRLTSSSHSMLAHTPCTSDAAHRPAAVPVPAPPALEATATASLARVPNGTAGSPRSIAAHKLLGLSAGTSGLHSMQAHTPCLSDAGQVSATVSTAAESGTAAAPCSGVSHGPGGGDLPLSSWPRSEAYAAAVCPAAEVQSYPVRMTLGASVDTTDSCGPATPADVLQMSHHHHSAPFAAPAASQAAAAGKYVRLGESPSSRSSSGTPAAGANVAVAAESSQNFSLGTASSCCTSHTPAVILGASPDAATSATNSALAFNIAAASATIAADLVAATHSSDAPQVPNQSNAQHTLALRSYPVSSIDSQTQQHGDSTSKPTASQVTAQQPAASNGTDMSSCRYATPAMDFGTPGTSNPEVYFTGLQHSSRSVSARPTSARDAADPVAFGGFTTQPADGAEAEEAVSSPVPLPAAVGAPATVDTSSVGQNLLQQLLASPSSSCASVAGSPTCLAAATGGPAGEAASDLQQQQQEMVLVQAAVEIPHKAEGLDSGMMQIGNDTEMLLASAEQTVAAHSPSAAVQGDTTCSRGSQTPPALSTGVAAEDQQLVSHAVSDVVSAVAAVSDVNEQEQQQEHQHDNSQGSSDGFTGMTFEQRLEMLCAEDSSETGSPSSAARVEVLEDEGAVSQEEPHAVLQTPVLPGHLVCVATQTSPLLLDAATQRCVGCDAETQVTPKPVARLPAVTPSSMRARRGWLAP